MVFDLGNKIDLARSFVALETLKSRFVELDLQTELLLSITKFGVDFLEHVCGLAKQILFDVGHVD